MQLDLDDEQVRAPLNLLIEAIEADKYPLSPRVQLLRQILVAAADTGEIRGDWRSRIAAAGEAAYPARTGSTLGASRRAPPAVMMPAWRDRRIGITADRIRFRAVQAETVPATLVEPLRPMAGEPGISRPRKTL
jgi:hypothetical protein